MFCGSWLRLVWQEKDTFKEASSPRNWCFRGGEEADDPDGCVYLCVTASVSCGVEVSRMINKNHIPGKRNGSRQTKGNIGIIVTLFFFFAALFGLSVTLYLCFHIRLAELCWNPPNNFHSMSDFTGSQSGGMECTLCVCVRVCVCVSVSVAALWVRNSRICPESSFILRHVSS